MAKLKLNKKLCKAICDDIRIGLTIESACNIHGISDVTYYRWLKRADDPQETNTMFKYFKRETEKAVADSEKNLLDKIYQDDSWQSSAWILERRFRDKYVKPKQVELSADVKADVNVKDIFTEEVLEDETE